AGGGTPLRDENWREMRSGNCVVALTAEPAELARRLNGPKGRPLLQPDIPSAIAALLPTRMARYLEADLAFSTEGKPAAEISKHHLRRPGGRWYRPGGRPGFARRRQRGRRRGFRCSHLDARDPICPGADHAAGHGR